MRVSKKYLAFLDTLFLFVLLMEISFEYSILRGIFLTFYSLPFFESCSLNMGY